MDSTKYLLLVFIVPCLCCKPKDLKCKQKELLAILELYKHYRELVYYQTVLIQNKDELSHGVNGHVTNSNRLQSKSVSSNVIDTDNSIDAGNSKDTVSIKISVAQKTSETNQASTNQQSQHITTRVGQTRQQTKHNPGLEKLIDELDTVLKEVRSILLLLILMPEQIKSTDIDLILDELYDKSPKQKHIPVITTSLPTTTTTLPLPTTTIRIPTTTHVPLFFRSISPDITDVPSLFNDIPTTATPVSNKPLKHQNKKKPIVKKKPRKKIPGVLRDAMKDYKDAMSEYNEVFAEFRMVQRLWRMFGRR